METWQRLMNPRYTMTLPIMQIQNEIFDAFTHCIDQFLTPIESPMFDLFWMSVMKELVVLKPISKIDSNLDKKNITAITDLSMP